MSRTSDSSLLFAPFKESKLIKKNHHKKSTLNVTNKEKSPKEQKTNKEMGRF